MALNPLQVLGISSFLLVGSGALISGVFENKGVKESKSILFNFGKECNTNMVNIYIMKKPENGKITKMKEKSQSYDSFFNDRPYSRNLESPIKKACQGGLLSAYVYEDNHSHWVYDESLQKHDWLKDVTVEKVSGIEKF